MRAFRVGVAGTILAAVVAGCGGSDEGTTMPASPPQMPPEADQMKKEFEKGLKSNFTGSKAPVRRDRQITAEAECPCPVHAEEANDPARRGWLIAIGLGALALLAIGAGQWWLAPTANQLVTAAQADYQAGRTRRCRGRTGKARPVAGSDADGPHGTGAGRSSEG